MNTKRILSIVSIILIMAMFTGCSCTGGYSRSGNSIPFFRQGNDNVTEDTEETTENMEVDKEETENDTGDTYGYLKGLKGGPIESWQVIGSWYGKYREPHFEDGTYIESFEADMNMSIDTCDEQGNLTGEGYTISVSKDDKYKNHWLRFKIKGTIDFKTGKFRIEQGDLLGSTSGLKNSYEIYSGVIEGDTMEGVMTNETYVLGETLTFSFGRVSKWAKDEITEANARGLIPPSLQGKDLSEKITRAEFAAVALELYKSLTNKEPEAKKSPFTDISGNENKSSIEKAYILNIVNGVSATKFEPNESISRQDLATMLCRALKKYLYNSWTIATDSAYPLDYSNVPKYADDSRISDYAKPSVYYLTKIDVISGIDNTHFAPQNTTNEETAIGYATATREQAIALSLRIYKMSDKIKPAN